MGQLNLNFVCFLFSKSRIYSIKIINSGNKYRNFKIQQKIVLKKTCSHMTRGVVMTLDITSMFRYTEPRDMVTFDVCVCECYYRYGGLASW